MSNLTRWNPRREADVFRPFDQLMDDLWRNWVWPGRLETDTAFALHPAMDVIENDNAVTVRIDLPGLQPEDVNVEFQDDMLTISGEMGDTIEQEGDRYHFRERRYGSFRRSLRLPKVVDGNKADAHFENGVLSIVLPKRPEAQPKQIKVKQA